jgi:hypothetical protein
MCLRGGRYRLLLPNRAHSPWGIPTYVPFQLVNSPDVGAVGLINAVGYECLGDGGT